MQDLTLFSLFFEYTLPKQASDISYRYLSDPEISRQVYAIHTHQASTKAELKALVKYIVMSG